MTSVTIDIIQTTSILMTKTPRNYLSRRGQIIVNIITNYLIVCKWSLLTNIRNILQSLSQFIWINVNPWDIMIIIDIRYQIILFTTHIIEIGISGHNQVLLKLSMSFTKSHRFRLIMEFRSKSRRFCLIMEFRSMPALCLSFTEPCRFRLFMECRLLKFISAPLGAERLGHSQEKWPWALKWKHTVFCQPLVVCSPIPWIP